MAESVWDSVQLKTCFVLLIGASGYHVEMFRLQFRCLLSQKSIQGLLELCNAVCIISYKW